MNDDDPYRWSEGLCLWVYGLGVFCAAMICIEQIAAFIVSALP